MRLWRRWVLLLLPVGAILLGPCASVEVSYHEAVSVEAIADPTLKLFWQLIWSDPLSTTRPLREGGGRAGRNRRPEPGREAGRFDDESL